MKVRRPDPITVCCGVCAFVLFGLAAESAAVGQSVTRIPTIDKVCGRLFSVADVNDAVEKDSNPLRKTSVRLYRHSDGTECCDPSAKVSETMTGRGRKFSFDIRKSQRGFYWLAITFNGRELAQVIRFEPPKDSSELCANSLFEVDRTGRFTLKQIVTVD